MTARLTSDFWVSAYLRRVQVGGGFAHLARKGAAEAGSIFVKIARMDRTADLYGPAPQSLVTDDGVRRFEQLAQGLPEPDVDARLAREVRFDSDCWIVEVEDRHGRSFGLLDE